MPPSTHVPMLTHQRKAEKKPTFITAKGLFARLDTSYRTPFNMRNDVFDGLTAAVMGEKVAQYQNCSCDPLSRFAFLRCFFSLFNNSPFFPSPWWIVFLVNFIGCFGISIIRQNKKEGLKNNVDFRDSNIRLVFGFFLFFLLVGCVSYWNYFCISSWVKKLRSIQKSGLLENELEMKSSTFYFLKAKF